MKRKFLAKQGISAALSAALLLSGAVPATAAAADISTELEGEVLSTEETALDEAVSGEEREASLGLTVTKVGNAASMPEAETNGAAAVAIVLSSQEQELYDYYTQISDIKVDGKQSMFSSSSPNFALYNGILYIYEPEIIAHFDKQTAHQIVIQFQDGSETLYEDEGYMEPEDTGGGNVLDGVTIQNVQVIDSYGSTELQISVNVSYTEIGVFYDKISEFYINDTFVEKEKFISSYKGLISSDETVLALMKESGNTVKIVFDDGRFLEYGADSSTDNPETPEQTVKSLDDVQLTENYGVAELRLTFNETDSEKLQNFLEKEVKEFDINGTIAKKSSFRLSALNGILSDDENVTALFSKDGGNTVKVILNNGSVLSWADQKTEEEQEDYTTADKLPAGEYTIGFDAVNPDTEESSMLQGFFDENVKLIVKEDGTMTIQMLNLLFAYSLYDFRVENGGEWPESQKEWFGEADVDGKYSQAIFTLPITDLDKDHTGAVLVGHMGGQPGDVGNLDKYTKVRIHFHENVKKGWTGYKDPIEQEEMIQNSDKILTQRLIESGVDTDEDGQISKEELQNATGTIDISGSLSTEQIYNIDILKDLGPGVTALYAQGNHITSLPEGIFDNAVGLQTIYLSGNNLTSIPKNLFDKNVNLEVISLATNPIGELPAGLFDENTKLKELDLSKIQIPSLPEGIFDSLTNLQSLYLYENNLAQLPDDLLDRLNALKTLSLSRNSLTKLPESIGSASSLEELDISHNSISDLPESIRSLTSLNRFIASYNQISEIPDGLWEVLSSTGKGMAELEENNLSSIPTDIILGQKGLYSLSVAYNYLPTDNPYGENTAALGISPETACGYYPQKTAMELSAEAKDGKITLIQDKDIDAVDMLYWKIGDPVFFGGKGILQSKQAYLDYLAEKGTTAEDIMLNEKNYNWTIVTDIDKTRDGKTTNLIDDTVKNSADDHLTFSDSDMKAGDVYTITKTVYAQAATEGMNRIFQMQTTAAAISDIPEDQVQTYEVPVSMRKAYSEGASMGNAALSGKAAVRTSEGSSEIEITFKSLQLDGLTGHLTRLYYYDSLDAMYGDGKPVLADVIETDGDYPKKVKIRSSREKPAEIGVRIWVDVMDEIAGGEGKGAQDAVLVLDWENASKPDTSAADQEAFQKTVTSVRAESHSYNTAEIQWDSVKNADGYYVYRKTPSDKTWKRIASCKSDTASYTYNKAVVGEKTYYTVKAYWKTDDSVIYTKYPTDVFATCVLDTPSVKAVSTDSKSATVTWNKTAGASSYIVYRSEGDNQHWKSIKTVDAKTTRYKDRTVSSCKVYYYTVRAAAKSNGSQVKSSYVKDVRCKILPGVPSVTAKAIPSDGIRVSWDKSAGASSYRIYRSEENNQNWKGLKTVNGSVRSYSDKTAEYGKTYYYTVRAVNGRGTSQVLSNYLKNVSAKCIPGTPKVTVSSLSSGVKLSWKTVPDATHYRVYRKTSASGSWKALKTVGSKTLSYTDTAAAKGKTYYYTVKALVKTGDIITGGSYTTVKGAKK